MDKILSFHPLLADKVRLSIMGVLANSNEPIAFTDLIEAMQLTKGNLSSHMKKLEEGGLIKMEKEFVNRKPRTTYECTPNGREHLKEYLEQIQALLKFN